MNIFAFSIIYCFSSVFSAFSVVQLCGATDFFEVIGLVILSLKNTTIMNNCQAITNNQSIPDYHFNAVRYISSACINSIVDYIFLNWRKG